MQLTFCSRIGDVVVVAFVLSFALVTTTFADPPAPRQATAPLPWQARAQGEIILSLAAQPDGTIWVGTETKGVWRYDPEATGAAQWTQFVTRDGLGDDSAYALAVDKQGRVWVGHLNHGLSVYNGRQWKNYDALTGPLGQRVFAIAVCPTDGAVWVAADAGISRYAPTDDTWRNITRADGLPSNGVSAIAFDGNGNVYVGTPADGVARADAAEGYKTWHVSFGSERMPRFGAGEGLPSGCVNDVLVASDGTLYAATTRGLAWSKDRGEKWNYRRGAEWIAKVNDSASGPPQGWQPERTETVAEDYVTALAEDAAGVLWVGYRQRGYECYDANLKLLSAGNADYVTEILTPPGRAPVLATFGRGIVPPAQFYGSAPAAPSAAVSAALPAEAKPLSAEACDALLDRLLTAKPDKADAVFLGDDWVTSGDWQGRYGRELAAHPSYGSSAWSDACKLSVELGPHHGPELDGPIHYYTTFNATDARFPYYTFTGNRSAGEWNDGSWQTHLYGPTFEGPDLWFDVTVPAGVHRVSLLFFNFDGRNGANRIRDFLVEVKPYADTIEEAEDQPALARARAVNFTSPVYKQFALAEGQYWIKVNRGYSFVGKVSGLYIDRLFGEPDEKDAIAPAYLQHVKYDAPPAPEPAGDEAAGLRNARELWRSLNAGADLKAVLPVDRALRLEAMRLARANAAPDALMAHFRWRLPLWTNGERKDWARAMDAAHAALMQNNPDMKEAEHTPLVEAYRDLP